MELEDDDDGTFAAKGVGDDGDDTKKLLSLNAETFWFKPVGASMSHFSVLGEGLCEFDFLVQGYSVKEATFDATGPTTVTLMESGMAMTCSISHIPFDQLSQSLTVWTDFDIHYKVIPSL